MVDTESTLQGVALPDRDGIPPSRKAPALSCFALEILRALSVIVGTHILTLVPIVTSNCRPRGLLVIDRCILSPPFTTFIRSIAQQYGLGRQELSPERPRCRPNPAQTHRSGSVFPSSTSPPSDARTGEISERDIKLFNQEFRWQVYGMLASLPKQSQRQVSLRLLAR